MQQPAKMSIELRNGLTAVGLHYISRMNPTWDFVRALVEDLDVTDVESFLWIEGRLEIRVLTLSQRR